MVKALKVDAILTERWSRFLGQGISLDFSPVDPEAFRQKIDDLDEADRKTVLGFQSPSRQAEWICGRLALQSVRQKLGGDPHVTHLTTLSHSRSWVLAVGALAKNSAALQRIGVDFELRDRKLRTGMESRWVSALESNLGLLPIDLWVIKEACYKANPRSRDTVVTKYEVLLYDPKTGYGEAQEPSQKLTIRFEWVHEGGWSFALARS